MNESYEDLSDKDLQTIIYRSWAYHPPCETKDRADAADKELDRRGIGERWC